MNVPPIVLKKDVEANCSELTIEMSNSGTDQFSISYPSANRIYIHCMPSPEDKINKKQQDSTHTIT